MIDWASICPVSYNTSGVWKRERPDIRINFKKKKEKKNLNRMFDRKHEHYQYQKGKIDCM